MNPAYIDSFLKLYWAEPHHHVWFHQEKSYSIMEAINLSLNPIGFHFHKFTADWQFETFYNWDVRLYNVGIIICDDEGKEYKYDDDTYDKYKKLIREANEREDGKLHGPYVPFGGQYDNGFNFLIEIKPM